MTDIKAILENRFAKLKRHISAIKDYYLLIKDKEALVDLAIKLSEERSVFRKKKLDFLGILARRGLSVYNSGYFLFLYLECICLQVII